MKKFLIPLVIVIAIIILIIVFALSGNSSENNNNSIADSNVTNSGTNTTNSDSDINNNSRPDEITEDFLRNYPETPASNFKYKQSTEYDGIKITVYTGNDDIVVIPEEIDGKPVVEIEPYTFANDSIVKAVLIPKTVETLLERVFANNDNLELVICEGVKNINDFTFGNCTSLRTVKLSNELVTIGDYAFFNCNELTILKIPASVTQMLELAQKSAFAGCPKLTIYGEAGSYIETVANEQGIPFVAE